MGNTFDKKIAWEPDPRALLNQRRNKLKIQRFKDGRPTYDLHWKPINYYFIHVLNDFLIMLLFNLDKSTIFKHKTSRKKLS